MKILGIDYGAKWIGLAISDDEKKLAFPYKTFENNHKIFFVLNEIVKKEEIYKIVIGLPINKKMEKTPQTIEVENWAKELAGKIKIHINFENEILTSKAADKLGAKNQHAAAAAIFLQSYLDKNNK